MKNIYTHHFAKTKILATLGPATSSVEKLEELINAGADAFRLNFSHGNYESFDTLFKNIDAVCKMKSMPISILIDLQGPKIRIGDIQNDKLEICKGDDIEITIEDLPGTKKLISTSYKLLPKDAEIGNDILIDDGLIHLKVIEKKSKSVCCEVIEGGVLKSKKGMNLPYMQLSTASFSEKDLQNLEFALNHRVDYVALSFVRTADDIKSLRKILEEKNKSIPIIAKIEKPEAVKNFDEILTEADGIMVARGDLGVELDPQDVPLIQKQIRRKCKSAGKLVITATQMLESMINNPVPTRAEASDVANAVWDGTDVVMLSGETSVGKYPVETVRTMNNILLKTESSPDFNSIINYEIPVNLRDNLFDSTGRAIVNIAEQINASLIVVFTHFGRKAKVISKYRPKAKIIAISDNFDTLNRLNIHYGIIPYFLENFESEEYAIEKTNEILRQHDLINKGDVIIYTAGAPHTDNSRSNWMRFAEV